MIVDDQAAFEKVASVEPLTTKQLGGLMDQDFALILLDGEDRMRKYAVHEPGHVCLSAHYYTRNRHKLASPAKKVAAFFIKRAHQRFNMPCSPELESSAQGVSAETNIVNTRLVKEANIPDISKPDLHHLRDHEWALIVKEGAYKRRMYPLCKKAHVEASILFFGENHDDLRPGDQIKVARSLLKKADQFDINIDESILAKSAGVMRKIASTHFSQDLFAHVQTRRALVDSKESRDTLDELFEKRAEYGEDSFIALLSKFDELEGLDRYYDQGLTPPMESALSLTKTASQVEFAGNYIGEDFLKAIPQKSIDDIFGAELGEKWASDAPGTFRDLSEASKHLVVEHFIGEVGR